MKKDESTKAELIYQMVQSTRCHGAYDHLLTALKNSCQLRALAILMEIEVEKGQTEVSSPVEWGSSSTTMHSTMGFSGKKKLAKYYSV